MALDPFFQQGMNNWSRAIADKRQQAAGLTKLTQAGQLKDLLARQDSRAKSALERLKHQNLMGQIGFRYNQMLPEAAKAAYGPQELGGLRGLQSSAIIENLGGVGQLSGKSGLSLTLPGLDKLIRGGRSSVADFRRHEPTKISTAAAGKDEIGTKRKRFETVRGKDNRIGVEEVVESQKRTRKVPKSGTSASKQKQLDVTRNFVSSNAGSTENWGKKGKGFSFRGMKGDGPVVGPDSSGRYFAVDIDGSFIDVTSFGK